MPTVLHLTVAGVSPTLDWYVRADDIYEVIDSSPVQIVTICSTGNMPNPENTQGIAVNETFASIMAALAGLPKIMKLTAFNVTPTQYVYVAADSIASMYLSSTLGTVVNTVPSTAAIAGGEFQVNESPASIAAQIGNVVTP
jgi:hypothetical protein